MSLVPWRQGGLDSLRVPRVIRANYGAAKFLRTRDASPEGAVLCERLDCRWEIWSDRYPSTPRRLNWGGISGTEDNSAFGGGLLGLLGYLRSQDRTLCC